MSVVTDGFDRKRSFEWTVRISGLQLNDCFCSPHQARHCTFILQKLFFLFLGNKSEGFEANGWCLSVLSGLCTNTASPGESSLTAPLNPSPPARPLGGLVVFFRPSHLPLQTTYVAILLIYRVHCIPPLAGFSSAVFSPSTKSSV